MTAAGHRAEQLFIFLKFSVSCLLPCRVTALTVIQLYAKLLGFRVIIIITCQEVTYLPTCIYLLLLRVGRFFYFVLPRAPSPVPNKTTNRFHCTLFQRYVEKLSTTHSCVLAFGEGGKKVSSQLDARVYTRINIVCFFTLTAYKCVYIIIITISGCCCSSLRDSAMTQK